MPICRTTRLAQSVVTLGNFDGIHRGHQQLIKTTVDAARELKLPSVVVTFEPQPKEYFNPSSRLPRLMRLTDKWLAARALGVDYLYCLRFEKKLANMTAEQFIDSFLLETLGARAVFIGPDFRFGKHRQGDLALLQQLGKHKGFTAQAIDPVIAEGGVISSTRIRCALEQGNIDLATCLLGHPYQLRGRITRESFLAVRRLPLPLGQNFHVRLFSEELGLNWDAIGQVHAEGVSLRFFDSTVSLLGRKLTVNILKLD
jgi:riboflavin kinase/FMN adenylyltransferase